MQGKDTSNLHESIYSLKGKSNSRQKAKNERISKYIRLIIAPLRVFEFLVVLLIFVLIIYTVTLSTALPIVHCISLIIIAGVYLIILSIDLIGQLRTGKLKTLPMFLPCFLGAISFSIIGALLIYAYATTWYLTTIAYLAILITVLFVIDVLLIVAYWKHTCSLCQQYCCPKQPEVSYAKKVCDPLCFETVKHDLMTSVSSVRVPSGDEHTEPDHSKRKISYGHRRQYVDCPTSARNLCFLEVADVQTERNQTSSTQSQTHREVREAPVQTVSRCELCNQQIQYYLSSPTQPTTQQSPCSPCPALVQLLRGTPCCPGCRCVRGIIQVSRQTQQQQTQRPEQPKRDKEAPRDQTRVQPVDDMLTSGQHQQEDPNLAGVPGIVTKLTLASYCVTPKKIHTSCQTSGPKTIKKNAEPEQPRRVSLSKKGKEQDQKPNTKDKNKVTELAAVEPAKQEVPEQPVAEKVSESPAEKPMEQSAQERGKSLPEVAKSLSEKSIDIHEVLSEKKLIPPRRQVAEMIDRLQEIEGTKSDFPLKQADLTVSGANETKRGILADGTGDKRNDNKQKTMQSRVIIADQNDEKAPSDSMKSGKVQYNSAPEVSTVTYKDSKTLMALKQTEDGHETKIVRDTKVSDSKHDVKKTVEQSQETDSTHQPQAETQTNLAEVISPNNRLKRTYVFRKKNKVEPAEFTHTDTNVQTSNLTDTSASDPATETETLFAEKPAPLEEKAMNICLACKRLQVPTTSSSFQYCYVHKDKRGRFYCEYCAPRNSVKVLHKKEVEQKNLACYACGNYLHTKSNQIKRNKTDNCPQCGQMQFHTQPTVSA